MRTTHRSRLLATALLALPLSHAVHATPSPAPEGEQEHVEFLQVMCDTSPRLEGSSVDVRVTDHIALLTGTARTLDQADFVASLALASQGIYGVINRIEILPVRAGSDELEEAVREAFDGSKALRADEVRVEIEAGRATLSGTVSTFDEREIARELASRVEGIRHIDNRIEIDFQHVRSDTAILHQLHLARQDDPLFDLLPLETTVKEGKVTLGGQVGSRDELERLARTAWVTGVTSVDSRDVEINPDLRMEGVEDKDYHPSDTLKVVNLVLEADERVDASTIESSLHNGMLTLRGTTATVAQRRAAEADVRGVPGVLMVRNLLELPAAALTRR